MPDIKDRIKEIIVSALNLEEEMSPADIADDGVLFGEGLGLDSVDALELAVEFERQFGVAIPDDDGSRAIFRDVRSIAEYISSQMAA